MNARLRFAQPSAAWAIAPGLAALVAAPFLASEYAIGFAFDTLVFIALAYGWNLISGYAGYLSFGQMAFFGVGAYTAALGVARLGLPWPVCAALAGVVAMAVAAPLGWAMLRLRGPYFALGMMGFFQVAATVASAWTSLTNGGEGVYLPSAPLGPLYAASVALVAVAIGGTAWLERSALGLRLVAIREDETAAQAMGVPTTRDKLVAFVLASALPGVGGALFALRLGFVDPAAAFPVGYEVQVVVMVLAGGAGTVLGPLVGGALLAVAGELLWARFSELHLALFGALVIAAILYLPDGLVRRLGWA